MPYIQSKDRPKFDPALRELAKTKIESAGELNYLLTRVAHLYLTQNQTSYKTLNDIVGVLECAKLEFYRRVASPYEDRKIQENGDV